jgi:hypothetical protein
MHQDLLQRSGANQDIEGVINSYELGFRMQACVPDLMDIRRDSQPTRDRYGIDGGQTDDFGRLCLMARRFAEAGALVVSVLANDSDPEDDELEVTAVTQGQHGTVTITGGGVTVTYEPDTDYSGPDFFA